MITIEDLEKFGANTNEGLTRCLNNKDFYLKMVRIGVDDAHFGLLKENLAKKDLEAAFEDAHALKGSIGNLSLTPIYTPLAQITEILRAKSDEGCDALCEEILARREELKKLMD